MLLNPYIKLQVFEGMWNGFDFYFLDRIDRIDGILFACGEMPSAERPMEDGRSLRLDEGR
jgi:hypothetical protein